MCNDHKLFKKLKFLQTAHIGISWLRLVIYFLFACVFMFELHKGYFSNEVVTTFGFFSSVNFSSLFCNFDDLL
jgi:hypothetical protein